MFLCWLVLGGGLFRLPRSRGDVPALIEICFNLGGSAPLTRGCALMLLV